MMMVRRLLDGSPELPSLVEGEKGDEEGELHDEIDDDGRGAKASECRDVRDFRHARRREG